MHVISLFPQAADCLMNHRRISMCKRSFCLDLFTRGHCHAEKDFQHTVRGKMFSRKIECILDLCKDLIFSKNLGFQTSCQIKKMLNRFFIFF